MNPLVLDLFCCYCSVAKSCPALCDSMDCIMPGFPVLQYLLEFAQTRVHWVGDAIQPLSFSVTLCSPPSSSVTPFSCPQSCPASGAFPMSQLFASGGQSIGASASVLPINIYGWFPLGLTGLIFLLSKWWSRVFSSTTVFKNIYSLVLCLLCGPNFTSLHDYWKDHSFI